MADQQNKGTKIEYRVFRVCVIGPKKSGKTSFINCIINKWGNGFFPGYTGDMRQFGMVDCFEPEDHIDQKPFFLLFHDLVAINDPVVNTDEKLKGQLQKVIENTTKPENVDLSMFPWEQENRPYSVFMFVAILSFKMSAIIDEIKKREDFKIGGKHVKLISKKFVIRTHTDLVNSKDIEKSQSSEFDKYGNFVKVMNVSSTTGENVADVIKELVDMLKDTMFEDFEKYIWENTSHPHQKPKEEGHNKDKEADDDENVVQTEDIKDLKLSKLADVKKKTDKSIWKALWPF